MANVSLPNTPANNEVSMISFWSMASANGGLAKSCRFLVRILPSPGSLISTETQVVRDLPYFCESAEFPGRGFINTDLRYYGPNFKAPLQTTYEDLNLTFLCRDDFSERQFFDSWMELINPSATYNFTYPKQYQATIEMFQLSDMDNKAMYKFTFHKVWPILVNPQPVTWADDNFHRLTVSFGYTNWRREELDTKALPGYDQLVTQAQSERSGGTIIPIFELSARG